MRQKSTPVAARWRRRDTRPTAAGEPEHFVGRLPFTYIDESILLTDAPEHPLNIHVEMRLEGRVDAGRLRSSLHTAAQRHPLARACVVPAKITDRTWHFDVASDYDIETLAVVQGATDAEFAAARDNLLNARIPTDRAPLFRVALVRHADGDRIIISLHHVAGDGAGAVRFARSVQRAYAGEDDPVADIELTTARDLRTLLAVPDRSERKRRKQARHPSPREVLGWKRCLLAGEGGTPSSTRRGVLDVHLSPEEEAAVRRRRPPGTTFNDLLIAAHHLTYERWNRSHGLSNDRIGTIMPVDMRPARALADVLSNYSLGVIVSTYAVDRRTFESTVRAVAASTAAYKRTSGAGAQLELAMFSRAPVGVKRYLAPKFPERFQDGLFSNLGSIQPFGAFGSDGGRVAELRLSPQVIGQPIGFVACNLGNRILISARYREADLDRAAAQKVIELFREVLLDAP